MGRRTPKFEVTSYSHFRCIRPADMANEGSEISGWDLLEIIEGQRSLITDQRKFGASSSYPYATSGLNGLQNHNNVNSNNGVILQPAAQNEQVTETYLLFGCPAGPESLANLRSDLNSARFDLYQTREAFQKLEKKNAEDEIKKGQDLAAYTTLQAEHVNQSKINREQAQTIEAYRSQVADLQEKLRKTQAAPLAMTSEPDILPMVIPPEPVLQPKPQYFSDDENK